MALNTIHLKGEAIYEQSRNAGAALLPGQLGALNSSGAVIAHATSGGVGESMIVQEDALQGKTVDNAYTSGDKISICIERSGNETQLRLPAAAAAIVVGDQLISDGAGGFIKTTGTPTKIFAVALEAKDNSAGATTVLIKARIL